MKNISIISIISIISLLLLSLHCCDAYLVTYKLPDGCQVVEYNQETGTRGACWNQSQFVQTLNELSQDEQTSILAYNDEPPPGHFENSSTSAHAKGILVVNATHLIWIVHSIPRYPPVQDNMCLSAQILSQEEKYGQIVFVSDPLPLDSVSQWLVQFIQIVRPNFYYRHGLAILPQALLSALDDTKFGGIVSSSASFSYGNYNFFAKAAHFRPGDLYADFVAPLLLQNKQSLYVQTWLNGNGGVLPSNRRVYNVGELRLDGVGFSTHADHSKWAVAVGSSTCTAWCIGDLNRQQSQFARGGQAICVRGDVALHDLFSNAVVSVQLAAGSERALNEL